MLDVERAVRPIRTKNRCRAQVLDADENGPKKAYQGTRNSKVFSNVTTCMNNVSNGQNGIETCAANEKCLKYL